MTFDTSLVDLNPNASFSTTESEPSDLGTSNPTTKTPTLHQPSLFEDQSQESTPKQSQTLSPSNNMSAPPKPSTPVQHIPTQDAYDQWSSVYDSDGNMLQAIDDAELETLLPDFLALVLRSVPQGKEKRDISLLDLGCGTGRNTAKLLSYASWPRDRNISVTGLDFSQGMLDIAERKLRPLVSGKGTKREDMDISLRLEQADCFPTVDAPEANPLPSIPSSSPPLPPPIDAVISTLVLEHIPLPAFFATLSALLPPCPSPTYALITNMHSDMGALSQAGFKNSQGVKIRGASFAHTLKDTVLEAQRAGFEVLGTRERSVEVGDVEGESGEQGAKWVGVKVWFAVWVRRGGRGGG
ncbi:hypothetical protein N0V83_010403 [Neocucurbitaria cava]|uniref:S-adenosyl-L-methionine-dependent methyltransferase n=1 Tax=Neocucurbitaria cava TaxID=798079 RepID=A0A9W9CHD5_9PLEO|nr:hypothetical protein N0V83_010403 [Neocucurbitaria cava]